jgi:hypothetical protein
VQAREPEFDAASLRSALPLAPIQLRQLVTGITFAVEHATIVEQASRGIADGRGIEGKRRIDEHDIEPVAPGSDEILCCRNRPAVPAVP